MGKAVASWFLHWNHSQNRWLELPVVALTPLLLVGIKHSSEITSFVFSWADCWRSWLHYSFSWKDFSDSQGSIEIILKKKNPKLQSYQQSNLFFQEGQSHRGYVEKAWTENGFLVSLEALYLVQFVSWFLFFISPFYFFSGRFFYLLKNKNKTRTNQPNKTLLVAYFPMKYFHLLAKWRRLMSQLFCSTCTRIYEDHPPNI